MVVKTQVFMNPGKQEPGSDTMGTGLLAVTHTVNAQFSIIPRQIPVILHGSFFHAPGMKITIIPHYGIYLDTMGTCLFAKITGDAAI